MVPVDELRVGMFVELPLSWHTHPFLTNSFVISSCEDIEKIRDMGVEKIWVDISRSHFPKEVSTEEHRGTTLDMVREREPVVPEELIATIRDDCLLPEKKANLVIVHANRMMKNLLEEPTAPRIEEAKKAIGEIVTLILKDPDTTFYLLNITNHDFSTYTHSVNVGILGVALSKSLFKEMTQQTIKTLGVGFFLHDLGKTMVDQAIITKPGKLTEEEMRQVRLHPGYGYRILVETKQITEASRLIVLQHHERADGTGYPKGLRNDEIHIYGRLCAIADVYDALTSERPYKKKMAPFEALQLMKEEMIGHFTPDLFERFVLMFRAPRKSA